MQPGDVHPERTRPWLLLFLSAWICGGLPPPFPPPPPVSVPLSSLCMEQHFWVPPFFFLAFQYCSGCLLFPPYTKSAVRDANSHIHSGQHRFFKMIFEKI